MTAVTRDQELAALRRPFLVGAALVLVGVAAIGVVVARFGSEADRPAGVAERWLVAVGDTTRDGVEEDARERLEELSFDVDTVGVAGLLTDLSETAAEEGESAFETVRVGPPVERTSEAARVPAVVTPRDADPVQVYLTLVQHEGEWRVLRLEPTGPEGAFECPADAQCPGFPIERPERAPWGWFAGALALGVVVTLGCMAAVRAATPKPT